MAVTKKKRAKVFSKPGVQKKHPIAKARAKKKLPQPRSVRDHGWMLCGFDTSMSSLAGAAIGYDKALNKFKGPYFTILRWSKDDHYFDRLAGAAKSHELVLDLIGQANFNLRTDEVFIAQEEPFPPHGKFMGKGASGFLKQQAEISGAFLGGLLRYGYREIWQMNNNTWRKVVADGLSENGRDITTHHSKWNSRELVELFNCNIKDSGKFRAKQWAFDQFGIAPVLAQLGFPEEIPDWPDIIESGKHGKIPRPESSKARAKQPDDRYDALAILWTLALDLEDRGVVKMSGI